MTANHSTSGQRALLIISGIADWLVILGTIIGGYFLSKLTPNKRPFQLENPDISFPYTVHETVSSRNLIISTIAVPVAAIFIASILIVPGFSAPPGTSQRLIWRRKLWEFYSSFMSFALGMASQYFIISGLKNICGKPRPDLLSRCQPDIQNVALYVVGGIANITSNGQLVSASICQNTDASILNDGFRSYPSGHSASAAAGLGHLALFLAFKFGAVFPSATPMDYEGAGALSTFPDPLAIARSQNGRYELVADPAHAGRNGKNEELSGDQFRDASISNPAVLHARQAGAAPPLYLLLVALIPFGGSVFIAASRWFNFRHHGFDILFGYFIGTTTTLISFRMYHLPLSHGAGWTWAPRSPDKAFWAGIGSNSWATSRQRRPCRSGDEEERYEEATSHDSYQLDARAAQPPATSSSTTGVESASSGVHLG